MTLDTFLALSAELEAKEQKRRQEQKKLFESYCAAAYEQFLEKTERKLLGEDRDTEEMNALLQASLLPAKYLRSSR